MKTASSIQYSGPAISPEVSWDVRVHLQALYQKLGNHTQAMSILAARPVGSTTTNTSVQESIVTGTGTPGGTTTSATGIQVNNQTGVTSYSTISGDNGSLVVLSDALPVAVSLTTQTPPWSSFIVNQGTAPVTLTPAIGTINGAASLVIPASSWAMVAFDGTNWTAITLPVSPSSFGPVAHEFLTAYNAATGAFSAAQPAFSDISGQITSGQLPSSGLSVTITTAALTALGTQGSMTFTNGLLTGQVAAT